MKLTREVKTGIFAITAILLFIFGYTFLKGSNLFYSGRNFFVKYDNVNGLASSAPVTVNGFQIGKVKNIEISDKNDGLIVSFSVNDDFEFSRNSVVEIYSSGLIGGNNLGILPEYDSSNIAVSGDTLRGAIQEGMIDGLKDSFAPLEKSLKSTLTQLDSVLTSVNQILDEKSKENLRLAIADLSVTMNNFKGVSNNLDLLLVDNKQKLDSTFTNLDITAQNFAKFSESLAQIEIDQMIKDLESTLAGLDDMMKALERGEGTLGKLLNDDELYDNLAGASAELEALLKDLKLNPKRYMHFSVFGKKGKEYEEAQDTIR